jgi:ribonuclease HII
MVKIIGIDDAGRGPVLGPMILAGVLADVSDNKVFREWGAKDSKLLTPGRRAVIKKKVVDNYQTHLEMATPGEIDESTNLNYLEAIETARIINKLAEDLKEEVVVYIDCPSVNIMSWTNDVEKLVKRRDIVKLKCEHKADLNHPIVSAASIVAKEKRESELRRLRMELGVDFGSGYPADPKTKDFIKENFDNEKYKSLIRFSWKTVKKLVKEKVEGQKKLF